VNYLESLILKKTPLWVLLLTVLLSLLVIIFFGAAVRQHHLGNSNEGSFGSYANEIAKIPSTINEIFLNIIDKGEIIPNAQLSEPKINSKSNLELVDENFKDDGFLLVSAYSDKEKVPIVYLYDLLNNKKLWQWVPKPYEIIPLAPNTIKIKKDGKVDPIHTDIFMSLHPLLLDDGSVFLTSGQGPLVKMNACGSIDWIVDRQFHHSLEKNNEMIIAPIVSKNKAIKGIRDDGYAILNINSGEIIDERSISEILLSNGYEGLAFGNSQTKDVIHLNDAEIIKVSDDFVQSGDIMFSARHISSVFLYRPKENKIIWLKTGPWLAQHDIDYLGNGLFSVFGNDLHVGGADILGRKNSNIYIYDMKSNSTSKPYSKVFSDENFFSGTEGRQRILENNDAFVEITNQSILARISKTNVRWKYQHINESGKAGYPHWSRYFYRNEISLDWLSNLDCN
jgi:hypothetical protein